MKTTCPMSLCLGTLLPNVSETYLFVMHFQFHLRVRVDISKDINIYYAGTTNNYNITFLLYPLNHLKLILEARLDNLISQS